MQLWHPQLFMPIFEDLLIRSTMFVQLRKLLLSFHKTNKLSWSSHVVLLSFWRAPFLVLLTVRWRPVRATTMDSVSSLVVFVCKWRIIIIPLMLSCWYLLSPYIAQATLNPPILTLVAQTTTVPTRIVAWQKPRDLTSKLTVAKHPSHRHVLPFSLQWFVERRNVHILMSVLHL